MKARYGFVSNSSSSSFMVGVANIRDIKLFLPFYRTIESYDNGVIAYNIYDGNLYEGEITEHGFDKPTPVHYLSRFSANKEQIHIESFQSRASIDVASLNKDDDCFKYIFYFNYENNEGDDGFAYDEWSGEYEYDIDLGFLPESQRSIYMMLMYNPEPIGLSHIDMKYGAGRNG